MADSVSSNIYKKAVSRADCTFEGIESMFFITLMFFEIKDACEHHHQVSLIDLKHEKHFQEQK